MAYYDEFQQLILKLDHQGEKVSHDIIWFKVVLNRDIASRLTLHKFDTIDAIFQATLEVEKELWEKPSVKLKGKSPLSWHKEKNDPYNMDKTEDKAAQAENKAHQRYPREMKVNRIPLLVLRAFNVLNAKAGETRLTSAQIREIWS